MFKKSTLTVAALLLGAGLSLTGFIPKRADDVLQNPSAPAGLKIDGNLSEWGNLVSGYDEETGLFYALTNDTDNIYLAIKSENKQDLTKILAGGLAFSVNTEGKKKEGASVIFPVISRQRTPNQSKSIEDIVKERLASAKEIRLNGFSRLPDGGISIANEYGIQAAANLNENNHFTYELAVPLKHLQLSASNNTPIAVYIKINGIARPATPQAMNPRMGGYGRWTGNSARNETEGFWIKRILTNK